MNDESNGGAVLVSERVELFLQDAARPIDFADAEITGYERRGAALHVSIRLWNEKRVEVAFGDVLVHECRSADIEGLRRRTKGGIVEEARTAVQLGPDVELVEYFFVDAYDHVAARVVCAANACVTARRVDTERT